MSDETGDLMVVEFGQVVYKDHNELDLFSVVFQTANG